MHRLHDFHYLAFRYSINTSTRHFTTQCEAHYISTQYGTLCYCYIIWLHFIAFHGTTCITCDLFISNRVTSQNEIPINLIRAGIVCSNNSAWGCASHVTSKTSAVATSTHAAGTYHLKLKWSFQCLSSSISPRLRHIQGCPTPVPCRFPCPAVVPRLPGTVLRKGSGPCEMG